MTLTRSRFFTLIVESSPKPLISKRFTSDPEILWITLWIAFGETGSSLVNQGFA